MTARMNGTLALWYESKSSSGVDILGPSRPVRAPIVRLHVNLWRDIDKAFNFLDVGFLLSEAQDLERLYLYLPAPLDRGSIFDLSNALKDADTLNAVFNEVAEVEREADEHFTVKTASAVRMIHHVDPKLDLAVNAVNVPGRGQGTIFALKSELCRRISNEAAPAHEHYVRLRVFLRGQARNLFTTDDKTAGLGLSLTQDVLETTEFRLNERRSYPPSMLQRATLGQVRLKSVHYFLIRSKEFQLGSQHQNFRKVRYLENDIWTNYLAVGQPDKRPFGRAKLAEGMIIYQWREIADDEKTLNDFIAYASFRMARTKILAYLVAILAIGGVGSALLNVTIAGLGWGYGQLGWERLGAGYADLYAGLTLGAVALLPMTIAWVYQRLKG